MEMIILIVHFRFMYFLLKYYASLSSRYTSYEHGELLYLLVFFFK